MLKSAKHIKKYPQPIQHSTDILGFAHCWLDVGCSRFKEWVTLALRHSAWVAAAAAVILLVITDQEPAADRGLRFAILPPCHLATLPRTRS